MKLAWMVGIGGAAWSIVIMGVGLVFTFISSLFDNDR